MKKFLILFLLILAGVGGSWFYVTHAQDSTSPRIISTSPKRGARNVPTKTTLHVYFSEPMDPSSITTDTFTIGDSWGNRFTGEVTYANNAATFLIFGHMDEMTNYTVTISGQVKDFAGNPMGRDYTWSFQTASD